MHGSALLMAFTGYEVGQVVNNNNNQARVEVITVKIPTQSPNEATTVYEVIWPYCLLLVTVVLILTAKGMIKRCLRRDANEGRVYYQQGNQQQGAQVQVQIPQNL